ncbi:MAG: FAD-dependent oxidoreductase [Deltaproteobacteria bacterium]|nr:FAD-dependent oxidoreductase [Deltaproteobacteria bacterium]
MHNDRKSDDVLVIGGGVIGLACAHYLRQARRAVRVIDQGTVGAGASHGNCGLVFTSDLVPLCAPGAVRQGILGLLRRTSPLFIKPTLDMGRISWLLRFAGMCRVDHVRHAIRARAAILKSSGHLYEALLGPGGLEAEYEKRGVLLVYRSEAAMQGYAAVNDLLRPHGLAAEALAGKALLDVEPALREDVYGAWYHRGDSHLRPDKLLASWKQALVRSGVVIEEDCRLERFRCAAGCVEAAVTNRGEYAARDFVLAAGAWSVPLFARLGLKLPMQPGKGYSITMERPAVCPQIPCYLYERRVVATPWPSGYRLGGTMEFSGFSTALNPRRLAALTAAAGEYLTDPVGHPVVEEWTGLRPMTYDDLPVIGRAPRFRNLTLATGHGMLGVTTAPATGKLVAEIVCSAPPHIDPEPFSVSRFQ